MLGADSSSWGRSRVSFQPGVGAAEASGVSGEGVGRVTSGLDFIPKAVRKGQSGGCVLWDSHMYVGQGRV